MKKVKKSSVFFMIFFVQANNSSIQFPPALSDVYRKEYAIEFHKPISKIDENNLSHVIIQGNYRINGYPLQIPSTLLYPGAGKDMQVKGFAGRMQFLPEISSNKLSGYLEHMKLDKVTDKGGYYEASYTMKDEIPPVLDNPKHVVLSTELSGRLYQCPLPSKIKVMNHYKTPFVKVTSLPSCDNLTKSQCEKLHKRMYVHKNNIHYLDTDTVAIAPYSDHTSQVLYKHEVLGQSPKNIPAHLIKYASFGKIAGEKSPMVITDNSFSKGNFTKPLAWRIEEDSNGKKDIYSYLYEAPCGDKILVSQPYNNESKSAIIDIPALHHMGFKVKEENPLFDFNGGAIIPPLYATQFTIENEQVSMSCVYAYENKQQEALVLKVPLEVSADRCFIYGKDAATAHEYNGKPLKNYYTINKDMTIVSQKGIKREGAPVLYVAPAAR